MNAKKKGNKWENTLANWLRDNGVKAWKDPMSGGGNMEKGDIINSLDMTIESKAYKVIALPQWWRQVAKSASQQGNKPVLFIHQDGMSNDPPEWLVVMHSEDWIEHVRGENEHEVALDYQTRSAIQNAKQALSTLLNKLPKV